MAESVSNWRLGLICIALACGDTNTPADGPGGGGTSTGGTSGGSATGGGDTAYTYPACTTELVPDSYGQVTISGQPALQGTQRVRLLERGLGFPPDFVNVDGADSADSGWLRVVELHAASSAIDAGDAGASDAGAADAPDVLGTERIILGPREVGELPVDIGAELDVSDDSEAAGGSTFDQQIVIRQAGRTLLLRHNSTVRTFGFFGGVLLALGPPDCSTPVRQQSGSEARCADIHRHELEVTVPIGPSAPGGATAAVASGRSKKIGDYRVFHGNTNIVALPAVYAYGAGCIPLNGMVQVTVVLAP